MNDYVDQVDNDDFDGRTPLCMTPQMPMPGVATSYHMPDATPGPHAFTPRPGDTPGPSGQTPQYDMYN